MKRLLILGFAAVASVPVSAAEVIDASLVAILNREGREVSFDSNIVPMLPGEACFTWYLRLEQAADKFKFVELYTLPEAVEFGTTEGGGIPNAQISAEGNAITIKRLQEPVDGWISNSWCFAEGDPIGPYSIEILAEGESLHRFDFRVVPPEEFIAPEFTRFQKQDVTSGLFNESAEPRAPAEEQ